jgi:hypothetical protein
LDIILKYEKREVRDFYDSGLLWLVSFEWIAQIELESYKLWFMDKLFSVAFGWKGFWKLKQTYKNCMPTCILIFVLPACMHCLLE